MKVLIIGGGIAGYTTALACQKFGIEYELFEAQNGTAQQGAGIWLAPNGLQVLHALSPTLVKELKAIGNTCQEFGLIHQSKKHISVMNMDEVESIFGFRHVMVHRNLLQNTIEKHLTGKIHYNKKLKGIDESQDNVKVIFEDDSSAQGSCILACDGVGSKVRQLTFAAVSERISPEYCWRIITDHIPTGDYKGKFFEMHGQPGLRAAYAPINEKQVYFFATAIVDKVNRENVKAQLLELVGDFPFGVKEIIESSSNKDWIIKPLSDFKPIDKWYTPRIVLVGDAAHAMTPNMGQGGNQAIESAYVIAHCLAQHASLEKAFSTYQKIRKPVVDNVIEQSWRFGKLIESTPKWKRDFIYKTISWLPKRMMIKQLRKQYSPTYLPS